MRDQSGHLRGGLIAVAISALWAMLAIRSPDLTYHFAPLLAALSWPVALRIRGRRTVRDAAIGGVTAFVLVTVVALILWLADALEGPTFWNDGPAGIEAIAFAAIGAVFGARVASRANPGLLGSLFQLN